MNQISNILQGDFDRSSKGAFTGAGKKAKELISLLVANGARIRRQSKHRVRICLECHAPNGRPAVEISFD